MRNFVLIGLIAAALVGCSSTPTTEAPVDDRSGAGTAAPGSTGAQTGGAAGGGVTGSGIGSGVSGNPAIFPAGSRLEIRIDGNACIETVFITAPQSGCGRDGYQNIFFQSE